MLFLSSNIFFTPVERAVHGIFSCSINQEKYQPHKHTKVNSSFMSGNPKAFFLEDGYFGSVNRCKYYY
jgi:hypothetical protein